ncbi:Lipase 2 [Penicillium subrubescens]|uniref:Lipase 2 n=1 Tax=Penicillium subrubescens TaxID=1316194 RepID=A0A1Q5TME6_9EURO|nr:Lipase 2 [Penicillium subrubescens]
MSCLFRFVSSYKVPTPPVPPKTSPRSPGHSVRAIVYHPTGQTSQSEGRPLHLNIHGGGFLGGLPEGNAPFCRKISAETGAVVVSTSYRYAPRYTFPVAHEDVQDVADWLIENSEKLWDADPTLMSVSGFSVGGNLVLGIAQRLCPSEYRVKAAVLFYTPVDFRLPPWDKPKPAGFPEKDPLSWILPLMDAYAGPERAKYIKNPLLHPILADIETLPRNMSIVGGKVDILLHEQTVFAKRLEEEAEAINQGAKSSINSKGETVDDLYHIESEFFDNQIHGWLELPSMFIDAKLRDRIFDDAIHFLNNVYNTRK